jgi:hypothetical protein
MSKPIQGYTFIVEGSHDFPFDMLRYDRCWPVASDPDVINLAPHPRGELIKSKRQVKLRGLNEPTDGRWALFGWKVVSFDRTGINV